MNEKNQHSTRVHNTVIAILTVAVVGTIVESVSQGWEFWVPTLLFAGLVASWGMHIFQYRQSTFRENYYLVFSMMVAFDHGTQVFCRYRYDDVVPSCAHYICCGDNNPFCRYVCGE